MHVRAHHLTPKGPSSATGRSAAGVPLTGFAGAVAGWLLPRGPMTTAETVGALVTALAVGAGAGWLTRARWILLVAPDTFMAVFEPPYAEPGHFADLTTKVVAATEAGSP